MAHLFPRLWCVSSLAMLACAGLGQQYIDQNAVTFRTYLRGSYSKQNEFKVFVIRNEAQWQEYWLKTTGNPARTAPADIDFFQNQLVAIHLGQRSTGGFSVYLDGASRLPNGDLRLAIVEQQPTPGQIVTMALTSPFTIVSMAKQWGSIAVTRSIETMDQRPPVPRPLPPAVCGCKCGCCCSDGHHHHHKDGAG